jgi:RNA-directed DNA polymerase
LVRWLRRKHRHLARGKLRAIRALERLATNNPSAFVHWEQGVYTAAR